MTGRESSVERKDFVNASSDIVAGCSKIEIRFDIVEIICCRAEEWAGGSTEEVEVIQ